LFRVRSYAEYGALSGRSVDDMIAGARVEVAPFKEDPMDFVLWKPSDAETPGWDSPWGRGRPGWHIECSAMSEALLGSTFDIHGGGNDLTFPHHENEIAQSKCAGHGFANVWLHNEMLQVEGKKMSKSLGNFFTIRDLLDQGVPGEVIRFVFLSTHYRKPMDWTEKKRQEAQKVLQKWWKQTRDVTPGEVSGPVLEAVSDDLNTAGAIAQLHGLSASGDVTTLLASARFLGLLTEELSSWEGGSGADGSDQLRLDQIAEYLSVMRTRAMETKDFSSVDRIKGDLVAAGVEVRMSKDGVTLSPTDAFDSQKLGMIESGKDAETE
jgi:cysteinyl-tRNA synthetase